MHDRNLVLKRVALLLACLLFVLFLGMDNHTCTDPHCLICTLLRPLLRHLPLIGSAFAWTLAAIVLLPVCAACGEIRCFAYDPVKQKVKISS